MKRAHLPAYSPAASQRAAVVLNPIRWREKRVELVARPAWPVERELGAIVLSFPRDLRPRAE